MKELNLENMEQVEGGDQINCGGAIFMGARLGGFFGPKGALIGAALVALGPNCLNITGQ